MGLIKPAPDSLPSTSSMRGKSTFSRPLNSSPTPGAQHVQPKEPSTHFVIPSEPPSKDQWVPDYQAEICMVCHVTRFSMVTWFHMCYCLNTYYLFSAFIYVRILWIQVGTWIYIAKKPKVRMNILLFLTWFCWWQIGQTATRILPCTCSLIGDITADVVDVLFVPHALHEPQ